MLKVSKIQTRLTKQDLMRANQYQA